MKTKEKVRKFILQNFMLSNNSSDLADDQSFMESGIIDSTGVLELVTFLEKTFNIKVPDEELLPENLDSIENLTVYIEQKKAQELIAA